MTDGKRVLTVGENPCPATGNTFCKFGYCREGRCHLKDFKIKAHVPPPPVAPGAPDER